MSGIEILLILGVLGGGFLGFRGPGAHLRQIGRRVALVCLGLYILLVLFQAVIGGVAGAIGHANPVLLLAAIVLVLGAGGYLYRERSALAGWGLPGRETRPTTIPASSLEPGFKPFVGKSNGSLRTVEPQDTIGVIGPPQSGKTSGILIPQAMLWGGPMISVSVRDDVLRNVGDQRQRIARPRGGQVYVFDPAESSRRELLDLAAGDPGRLPLIRWSPLAGCETPEVAKLRAEAMVWASIPTDAGGAARHPHFERLASLILRTTFHAAALHGRPLEDVLTWIDGKDFVEPAGLIRDSSSTERGWVTELLGLGELAAEERGSAFSTAANALDAFKLSTVRRNCSRSDLDLRSFVKSHSSLFVIAGVGMQKALAPLFSAMLEGIAFSVIDDLARADGGRVEPRLLIQLDEIANIAPLPNLLTLLTVAGGSGICLSYASQNWQQVAARYGKEQMKSIWQSTKAQVVFGGVGDREMLDDISRLMGVKKERTRSKTRQSFKLMASSTTVGEQEVPRLRPDEIFNAGRSAHLFYRSDYERVEPAPYFDPTLGRPFHAAAGWNPAAPAVTLEAAP